MDLMLVILGLVILAFGIRSWNEEAATEHSGEIAPAEGAGE
jgi:hypothetical protein